MKILILGGKRFLGRAIVEAVLRAGHTPTLFNRGKTNPELFPNIKNLIGDRDTNLEALKRRKWDAIIDTSGYLPRVVKKSALALSGKCEQYVFISTISVYRDYLQPDIDESYPLAQLADPDDEDYTGDSYGPLKALCEYEIQQNFDGKVLVIRPGVIVGPQDPTDRFTYWPHRVAQGGRMIAPSPPSASLQFIDVRDLAEFIVRMVEKNAAGAYNAVGPRTPATFGSLLVACREAALTDAEFVWMEDDFLLREAVQPWTDLPLWVPASDPSFAGFYNINNSRAVKAGLTFRSLSQTVSDTLAWIKTWPPDRTLKVGIDRAREKALLAQYEREPKIQDYEG